MCIERNNFSIISDRIFSHCTVTAVYNSLMDFYCLFSAYNFHTSHPQTLSIGFRSGERAGQSITRTPSFSNQDFASSIVCIDSLSFWNVHETSIFFSTNDNRKSLSTCEYFVVFCLPFVQVNFVRPLSVIPPYKMKPPSPFSLFERSSSDSLKSFQ